MLLAIDIGNTNIKFGLFDSSADNMLFSFSASSASNRTADEFLLLIKQMLSFNSICECVTDCVISSVVPSLTTTVSSACVSLCNKNPFIIGSGTRTGFPIKIDVQSQLGADIVSNTAAAFTSLKPPFAVVDVGTATTVTCIDPSGQLIGTVIAPGAQISLDALQTTCALLTDTSLSCPDAVIGKNSQVSIQSGSFWGHVYMIDGFIRRLREELCGDGEKLSLIGTGGLSEVILPFCRNKFILYPHLTLKGAASLFFYNTGKRSLNYTK